MGSCISSDDLEVLEGDVGFDHFKVLRAIGKGSFGKVCIVKKRDTKDLYAMKYISKARIVRKNAVDNVLQEVRLLRDLTHPFVVNMWFSFQDEEDLFLVEDCLLGGDLSWHLEQVGRMDVHRVKLYVAEMALALEYLRKKKVIHRDIKPANVLLDSNGHVHLTDFNVACYVVSGVPLKSCTGTKPYMAPEVYQPSERGYSYAVDWWSLGVTAYELLKGVRPFPISASMNSTSEINSMLMSSSPQMSTRWDDNLQDFIRQLLKTEHRKRISSLEAMRQHPFYSGMDFVKVQNMEMSPTYVPPKNKLNCDPTHELEEIILEPNPLHKKSQRLHSRQTITLHSGNSSEVELKELNRLQQEFFTYNRLEDNEKVEAEKELHRKISSGDIAIDDTTSPMRTATLPVIEDDQEEPPTSPPPQSVVASTTTDQTVDPSHKAEEPQSVEKLPDVAPVEQESSLVEVHPHEQVSTLKKEEEGATVITQNGERVSSAGGEGGPGGEEGASTEAVIENSSSEVRLSPVSADRQSSFDTGGGSMQELLLTTPADSANITDEAVVPNNSAKLSLKLETATPSANNMDEHDDREAKPKVAKLPKISIADSLPESLQSPSTEDDAPLLLISAAHFEQEV